MVLTLDIGNSRVHAGVFARGRLKRYASMTHPGRLSRPTAVSFLKRLRVRPDGVSVASVAPRVSQSMIRAIRRLWRLEPLVVTDHSAVGLSLTAYERGALGADRIAGAVGAWRRYRTDLIVIDFGTATTFNVVNRHGDFAGGLICPGVETSLHGLLARASLLPKIRLSAPRRTIGRTTKAGMRAGIMLGTAAMVDGLVDGINRETRRSHLVVATGGWGRRFARLARSIDRYDEHLNLRGAYEIYLINEEKVTGH